MNKLFQYAGIAASVVLIAFGIGALYMGIDGRFMVLTVKVLIPATKREGSRAQAGSAAVAPA